MKIWSSVLSRCVGAEPFHTMTLCIWTGCRLLLILELQALPSTGLICHTAFHDGYAVYFWQLTCYLLPLVENLEKRPV